MTGPDPVGSALLEAFAFVLGLVVGSFLNVVISRVPEGRSIVRPASHCPACGHPVRARDNVPVISWLLLRGRCRDCGAPISPVYPAVELLVGLLAWVLWRRTVPGPEAVDLPHVAAFLVRLAFVSAMVVQALVDVRHQIVLDELSIYAVPVGVAASALLDALGAPGAIGWRASVLGALAGGGVLLAVAGAWLLLRRGEGMGLGDVKLLAMIGSFLGPFPGVFLVLLVGSVVGSVVGAALALAGGRSLRLAVPFGPFLALGAVLTVLHGPAMAEWLFPGWAAGWPG